MIKPDFDPEENPLNECETNIVSKFLRALFLTQQNGQFFVEEKQVQIFTDELEVKVSKHLINFTQEHERYLGMECLKKHALLKVLRGTSYEDGCAEYTVKFHNIISGFMKDYEY